MRTWRTDEVFADGEGISVKMTSANHHVCPHTHDFIEIIYIASGEGVERIDGVMHEVKRGDLLFVNFGETHSFLMSGMKYVNILIRPEFISDVLLGSEDILDVFALPQFASIPGEFTKSCIVSFSGDELLRVGETVNAMISEYSEKRPGYKTLLHGYTQVLIAMLIRKLKCNTEERDTVASRIEHYIDEHLGERLTLSDIAENCFYNPSYFSRKFKSIYGKNLGEYIKAKRLDKAAELLSDSTLPVDTIKSAVGFSDKTQFYKAFRERFSVTPSEYRKCKKTIPFGE